MQSEFNYFRQHVDQLVQAAIVAADPALCVEQHLRRDGHYLTIGDFTYDRDLGRVYLVGIGKAAVPMGVAAAKVVAGDLTTGILVSKKSDRDWDLEIKEFLSSPTSPALTHFQGDHPISGQDSVLAATAVMDMLSQTTAEDLVLCLISGGASALHAYPKIPLEVWRQLNSLLLSSGCTISEMNCVRRQLDHVKGGGIARVAAPAACVSLILSDVVGNPLDIIGSGPTALHNDTPYEALSVLAKYDIKSKLDVTAWEHITVALQQSNTMAQPNPHILRNVIVGDIRQAANAALVKAAQMGFLAQILTTKLEGESREVARVVAAIAKDLPPGRCVILGGETTVTVLGNGRGGRNQEMALAAAIEIAEQANIVIACFSTDGEDGPTDVAGAVVTGQTIAQGQALNLDPVQYLADNNSYQFFEQLENNLTVPEGASYDNAPVAFIKTGPTGTNVNDLIIILSYPLSAEDEK